MRISRDIRPVSRGAAWADAEFVVQFDTRSSINGTIREENATICGKLKIVHLLNESSEVLYTKHVLMRSHIRPGTAQLHTRDMVHDDILCPCRIVRVVAPVQDLGNGDGCVFFHYRRRSMPMRTIWSRWILSGARTHDNSS